jgi:flagellar basal-body rod protein FlgG
VNNSLYIGATGMAAQQVQLDAIANNLANVNTPAYKADRVSFQTLFQGYVAERAQAAPDSDLQRTVGMGVAPLMLGKVFTVGELKKTDQPLDLALNGDGFIEVLMSDGSSAYTRSLSLQVNRDGLLATADGLPLHQSINIPTDATGIIIDRTGKISVTVPDEKAAVELGQLELTRFINPAGLLPLGSNLYSPSEKAGEPISGKPGEAGFGSLSQGYLEASNVRLVDQMILLTMTRQVFEISAKVVQAADEMAGVVNNLKR